MNRVNGTGVKVGSPKNTSAKKIYSISGPSIPKNTVPKSGSRSHDDVVNK